MISNIAEVAVNKMDTGQVRMEPRNKTISGSSIMEIYNFLFTELADPRTNDWFMVKSPFIFLLLIFYLYFVTSWGPRFMKDRKPFEMTNLLIFYNACQVALSVYIFYEGLDAAWLRRYSWKCQPVDFSWTPEALREARGVYTYYIAKITELLDTVFFVLRKKQNQVTFLHIYHHTVMPMIAWGTTKYYPGGHGTFIGVINSFVHIVMYSYYMLSAMGPWAHKYLWWKKYITVLQLVQFLMAFLHTSQLMFYDCDYPRVALVFVLPNLIFFYVLFTDFYAKAYENKKKKQARPTASLHLDNDQKATAKKVS